MMKQRSGDTFFSAHPARDRISAPRVKVCCIASVNEARMAIDAGASAIGLVSEMPSGPGVIPESGIREVVAAVPPSVATFLLTSETSADRIIEQQRRLGANTLQLVDEVELSVYGDLREALPEVALVQVIHVRDDASLGQAARVAPHVDAILLDSGNPALAVKELGGTGRTHDWAISRRLRESVGVRVFLAGGLNAGNVRDAVTAVQPFGVDVCSGLRTGGKLDSVKLAAFFAQIRPSSTL